MSELEKWLEKNKHDILHDLQAYFRRTEWHDAVHNKVKYYDYSRYRK